MLAKRLKDLREDNDLTQNHLSKKLNITAASISRWETGQSNPDYDTLIKLAKLYNVSIDYLLGLSEIKTYKNEFEFISDLDLSNEELMKKYNLYLGNEKIDKKDLQIFIELTRKIKGTNINE